MIVLMRSPRSVIFSLLLVTPGCAWGSDSSESERRTLDPDTPWGAKAGVIADRNQVRCDGEGDLVIVFSPPEVTVSRGRHDLAHASLSGMSLSDACVKISPSAFFIRGSPPRSDPVYDKTELECRVPAEIDIQVHPILEGGHPRGSVVLIVRPDSDSLVASVPLKKGGSRLYFNTSMCARSS
jgi:hypothetical protein